MAPLSCTEAQTCKASSLAPSPVTKQLRCFSIRLEEVPFYKRIRLVDELGLGWETCDDPGADEDMIEGRGAQNESVSEFGKTQAYT